MQEGELRKSIVNSRALKICRYENDVKQDDVANAINVNRGTYSKKENGLIALSIDEAVEIAVLLRMDFEQFNKIFANNKLRLRRDDYLTNEERFAMQRQKFFNSLLPDMEMKKELFFYKTTSRCGRERRRNGENNCC